MAIKNFLSLDVGSVRIGVGFAGNGLLVARPLTTLEHGPDLLHQLKTLIIEHSITTLVIGLPRGLDGQETEQTTTVRAFADDVRQHLTLPIQFQDEALTSIRAKEILSLQKQPFDKKDVDATAASLILSDYLEEHKEEHSA